MMLCLIFVRICFLIAGLQSRGQWGLQASLQQEGAGRLKGGKQGEGGGAAKGITGNFHFSGRGVEL